MKKKKKTHKKTNKGQCIKTYTSINSGKYCVLDIIPQYSVYIVYINIYNLQVRCCTKKISEISDYKIFFWIFLFFGSMGILDAISIDFFKSLSSPLIDLSAVWKGTLDIGFLKFKMLKEEKHTHTHRHTLDFFADVQRFLLLHFTRL